MVATDGKTGFLGTDDLSVAPKAREPILRSVLNAKLLDEIKRAAIEPTQDQLGQPIQAPAEFIAQRLHVYITISNLRGIPFNVQFGRNTYGMQTIGDRIHYVITDLGAADLIKPGSWVEADAEKAAIPISVNTLPTSAGEKLPEEWDMYGTSALASGAFPIGLACRRLSFGWDNYLHRRYPIPIPDDVTIKPSFPTQALRESANFTFESVDGGLVNNSPFDYAQYALTGRPAEPIEGKHADHAIIMVAPFPEPPEFLSENSPSPAVTAITRALFPALVNQARFRASELAPAASKRDASQFMIAPMRRVPRTTSAAATGEAEPSPERFSIACGLLGGFGGFLDEQFRAHDFQLGRRNCQQFLRGWFNLPADDIVVGLPGLEGTKPVIPLLGSAKDPVPLPRWPRMDNEDFGRLCESVENRIDTLIPVLIEAQTSSVKLRTALKFGWRQFLRSRTIEYVRLTVLADLVRRGQIEGWDSTGSFQLFLAQDGRSPVDIKSIVAELLNPAYDLRTAAGIAKHTHLPQDFVRAVLDRLTTCEGPLRVWRDGDAYTLFLRRPGFLQRLGPVRWFNLWWNAAVKD